jgi:hypothetical protein
MPTEKMSLNKKSSAIYTTQEKANTLSLNEAPSSINMYVLSYDVNKNLQTASPALKQNIITYLSQYRMVNDSIKLKDAFIINIGVDFDIVVLPNYNNDEVLLKCIQTIQNYFKIDNWQVNQPIILRDLYVGLDNIDMKHAGLKNIPVVNTPNASSRSVAELVFAHLFSVSRFLHL